MAVLRTEGKQKIILNYLSYGVLTGCLILFIIIINQSSNLTNSTGTISGNIFGLKLFQVSKNAIANGGFRIDFAYNFGGIIPLLITSGLIGASIGIYKSKNNSRILN